MLSINSYYRNNAIHSERPSGQEFVVDNCLKVMELLGDKYDPNKTMERNLINAVKGNYLGKPGQEIVIKGFHFPLKLNEKITFPSRVRLVNCYTTDDNGTMECSRYFYEDKHSTEKVIRTTSDLLELMGKEVTNSSASKNLGKTLVDAIRYERFRLPTDDLIIVKDVTFELGEFDVLTFPDNFRFDGCLVIGRGGKINHKIDQDEQSFPITDKQSIQLYFGVVYEDLSLTENIQMLQDLGYLGRQKKYTFSGVCFDFSRAKEKELIFGDHVFLDNCQVKNGQVSYSQGKVIAGEKGVAYKFGGNNEVSAKVSAPPKETVVVAPINTKDEVAPRQNSVAVPTVSNDTKVSSGVTPPKDTIVVTSNEEFSALMRKHQPYCKLPSNDFSINIIAADKTRNIPTKPRIVFKDMMISLGGEDHLTLPPNVSFENCRIVGYGILTYTIDQNNRSCTITDKKSFINYFGLWYNNKSLVENIQLMQECKLIIPGGTPITLSGICLDFNGANTKTLELGDEVILDNCQVKNGTVIYSKGTAKCGIDGFTKQKLNNNAEVSPAQKPEPEKAQEQGKVQIVVQKNVSSLLEMDTINRKVDELMARRLKVAQPEEQQNWEQERAQRREQFARERLEREAETERRIEARNAMRLDANLSSQQSNPAPQEPQKPELKSEQPPVPDEKQQLELKQKQEQEKIRVEQESIRLREQEEAQKALGAEQLQQQRTRLEQEYQRLLAEHNQKTAEEKAKPEQEQKSTSYLWRMFGY